MKKSIASILWTVLLMMTADAFAGATNLPAWSTQSVATDSNGVFVAPAGLLASNAVALANPAVVLADESFAFMSTADGITWTNASGWSSTASVSNGLVDLDSGSVISPLFTGSGFRTLTAAWSNLSFTAVYSVSTNETTWMPLSQIDGAMDVWTAYRVRISAANMAPTLPAETNVSHALLNSVRIEGHQIPTRLGATNDFFGVVIRVDNPAGSRDAVNLQTLNSRLAAYVPGTASGSSWSEYPASNIVDFAGYGLKLDPRYLLAIAGDTVALTFGGAPLFEITGSATATPQIVRFSAAGTNLSASVVGAIGWRPYPQWSTNLVAGVWTSLTTNQFQSTYPAVTNGLFTLGWNSLGTATEFWRISALDETGGTNGIGIATFRVPVSVPALTVNGVPIVPGEAVVSNAVHALTAGYATNAGNSATAGNATSAGHAATAGYATNAGNSATAGYATNAGHAATATSAESAAQAFYANDANAADYADSAGTSAYASNAGTAATATYATSAGGTTYATYSLSAGNAKLNGSVYPLGSAALLSSNSVSDGRWVTSVVLRTNLIVAATNGANYNGPPKNTVFFLGDDGYPYYGHYCATNSDGNIAHEITRYGTNEWHAEGLAAPPYYCFLGSDLIGTYSGTNIHLTVPGTGTFTIVGTTYWKTNTVRYLENGTGTFFRISGPATNQFAPPLTAPVRWSGAWTNILGTTTNLLQFFDGYATNAVTL